MRSTTRNALLVLGLAAASVAFGYGLARRVPRTGLLDEAPARTILAVDLAVPRLRRAPLVRTLLAPLLGANASDVSRLERLCGFDPLDLVERIQLYVLATDTAPGERVGLDDLALIVRGPLDREALAGCVSRAVDEDGGGVHAGSVEGLDAILSDHGSSAAAFLGRDAVVVGDVSVIAELARRRAAGGGGGAGEALPDEELARLLPLLDPAADLRLVARLPPSWQRAAGRIARALELGAGLDAVHAVALDARLLGPIAIHARLAYGSSPAARAGGEALAQARGRAADEAQLAEAPFAALLSHADVTLDATDALASIELSQEQSERFVRALDAWLREPEPAPDAE